MDIPTAGSHHDESTPDRNHQEKSILLFKYFFFLNYFWSVPRVIQGVILRPFWLLVQAMSVSLIFFFHFFSSKKCTSRRKKAGKAGTEKKREKKRKKMSRY
jgi:hypothetical protein